MDFDFSDEQEQLRDAVRKWVDKAYGFDRHRAISRSGGFSRSLRLAPRFAFAAARASAWPDAEGADRYVYSN